ncbi:MAG: multidrug effflux MFS transporter, partial [Alphaproteobacteria bacterium]
MTETVSAPARRPLALVLGAAMAFTPLAIDMYLPALPSLQKSLDAGPGAVQLTLATFFAGLALGQALYGPFTDRFGRRVPLMVGMVLFVVASVGCALAPSIDALIVLRFFQALGGCAGMVVTRAVVRDHFDERGSARMFAMLMLVMGVAPVLAPLIGAQILVNFGWSAIFWALAGFGALCLGFVAFALPESLPADRRQPLGLMSSLRTYGRLLVDRPFMSNTLACAFSMTGLFAYIAGSPYVFIELFGVSPENYGWLFGLNALGLIAASQINHRLLAYWPGQKILSVAVSIVALSGIALFVAAEARWFGLVGIMVPLFFYLCAMGFVIPTATAAAMAPHGRVAGSASSL